MTNCFWGINRDEGGVKSVFSITRQLIFDFWCSKFFHISSPTINASHCQMEVALTGFDRGIDSNMYYTG